MKQLYLVLYYPSEDAMALRRGQFVGVYDNRQMADSAANLGEGVVTIINVNDPPDRAVWCKKAYKCVMWKPDGKFWTKTLPAGFFRDTFDPDFCIWPNRIEVISLKSAKEAERLAREEFDKWLTKNGLNS